jgi:hypothetical protein
MQSDALFDCHWVGYTEEIITRLSYGFKNIKTPASPLDNSMQG